MSFSKQNYKKIYAWEDKFARSVAYVLIPSRPIGVWEFLIPIVFLLNYMKNKQEREVLTQNIFFTKKLAMEAAREMHNKGLSKDQAMSAVKEKTRQLLASVEGGIYSESIQKRQMDEIRFLLDHFDRLLSSEGDDIAAMMRKVYPHKKAYRDFLKSLKALEREVTRAARKTLGGKADPVFIKKMESVINQKREGQTETIFPPAKG